MSAPARFDLSRDDPRAAHAAAVAALDRGELVVVPTETVYGVAAREDRPEAIERLARLKAGRQRPFSLAVASLEMVAERLAGVPATALPLMRRWWPGPLTLVLARREGGTLGVRVPGHAWTRDLIAAAGVPLLLPSANLPDAPAPDSVAALSPGVLGQVAVVVDGGRAALGEASTLVQPLPGGLRVLREGVVSRADLARHARPHVLIVCSGNTCRSPMAELLLRRALEARVAAEPALLPADVASRGLHVRSPSAATEEAVVALDEMGLDLGDHASRPLDLAELRRADLVLCMTAGHRSAVHEALAGESGPLVKAFDPSGEDVEDPFGGPLSEYRVVARRLAEFADVWAQRLLPRGERPMKIALGADHAGVDIKQRLVKQLQAAGHDVTDRGTLGTASVDYPDFAALVAHDVADGRAQRGILVCGTGIGMCIAANKVAGVRAAKCNDPYEATMSRQHNDANVLCLGARVLDETVVDEIVKNFLGTEFEGGRHARRVAKMMALQGGTPAGSASSC